MTLTGQVLRRVNTLLYVGTWLCFFMGILGPIIIAFICVTFRPAVAVVLTIAVRSS
jgi:hypothetical protein